MAIKTILGGISRAYRGDSFYICGGFKRRGAFKKEGGFKIGIRSILIGRAYSKNELARKIGRRYHGMTLNIARRCRRDRHKESRSGKA